MTFGNVTCSRDGDVELQSASLLAQQPLKSGSSYGTAPLVSGFFGRKYIYINRVCSRVFNFPDVKVSLHQSFDWVLYALLAEIFQAGSALSSPTPSGKRLRI